MALTVLLLILIIILAIVILAETVLLIPKIIVRFAPKDIQEVVLRRPDAPMWKVALGIVLTLFLFFCVALILFYAGYDAKMRGMGFSGVFLRFLVILEGYKLFDMVAFDYVLLTRLNIFQRLFPETVGCKGYESFGFNLKSQLIKVVFFVVISFLVAFFLTKGQGI